MKIFVNILVHTKTWNEPKRAETTRNHPKRAETTRNHPEILQNHPKPPETTQKQYETTRNQPLNISKTPTQPKNSLQYQIYTILVPKIKNCQISMKFGILIKSIMLNKMVMMRNFAKPPETTQKFCETTQNQSEIV